LEVIVKIKALRRDVLFCLLVVSISGFLLKAGAGTTPSKIKKAKSQGNDQNTFSMSIDPSNYPFCNITEVNQAPNFLPPDRVPESTKVPALLSPGVCQDSSSKWELASEPHIPETYRKDLQWSPSTAANWSQLVSGTVIAMPAAQTFQATLTSAVGADANKVVVDSIGDASGPHFAIGSLLLLDDGTDHSEVLAVSALSDKTLTVTGSSRTGGMYFDHAVGATLKLVERSKDGDSCLAGRADILLERSFRYGFCDKRFYHVNTLTPVNPNFQLTDADYYIVNIVVWNKGPDGKYSATSSQWYVYNRGDHGKWYRQSLPDFGGSLRIYGTKKPVGLVAIHIRPDSVTWDDFQKLKASYSVTVKSKTAANVTNFTNMVSIIFSSSAALATQKDPDGFYGAMFFKAKAPSDITINAEVDFPKPQSSASLLYGAPNTLAGTSRRKVPIRKQVAPVPLRSPVITDIALKRSAWEVTDATQILNPQTSRLASSGLSVGAYPLYSGATIASQQPQNPTAQGSGGTGTQPKPGGAQSPSPKPSGQKTPVDQTPTAPTIDCQATGQNSGQQSPCKFVATVDDEDLYHWDVSFGVPFRTITSLTFNQSSGSGTSVVPKSVTQLNAYAFFDVYPIAADIKSPPLISLPHVMVGLPISGKVFNKPIFGAGEGVNLKKISFLSFLPLQFQFFGGIVYNKEFRQIPGTTGSANVVGHRVWNGTYGVEIPVSQFKGLLKKKSSSTATGTTPTGKTDTSN
jgi:hypothetical protein